MLPTYVVRMPAQPHHDGSVINAQRSGDGPDGGEVDSTAPPSYPPENPQQRRSHAPSPPSPLQRLFGRRGITSLTVNVSSPASDKRLGSAVGARGSLSTAGESKRGGTRGAQTPQPSLWGTWEFRFYYLVFAVMVPLMVWVPVRLSQASNPNFHLYRDHLKQGWLFGRLRDDSDFQYRSFRDYVPALAAIMALYLVLSKVASLLPAYGKANVAGGVYRPLTSTSPPSPEPRRNRRVFLGVFTAIFVLALHGANTLKLLAVLLANYGLARALGGRKWVAPAFIWTFNIGALAAVHWNDGFQWHTLGESGQLSWLDDYNGLLPRWQINFNITMLRLVSFALDLHWSRLSSGPASTTADLSHEGDGNTDNRTRATHSRPAKEYSLADYLTYALYPPLFIAGPIISFNDFMSQLHSPPRIPLANVLRYALRFVFCLLTMEFILHFMYVNAIKDTKAWQGETPLELSMVGFWNLIVVWLKLLIPWRFFRLWSISDGVDPPENMVRCMANNYSTMGFWRSWHRSYNMWIVRYIYIPVGGARNTFGLPATLLVFTFVALWHDLSLKLLTWGWLVTLFILPEIVAKTFICPQARYGSRPWYRHVCALGGVFNVLLMMTANLVGFAIGVDGISYMWTQLLGSWGGLQFLVAACATLFVGVQAMFEYREEELRRGIARKC